MRSPGRPCDRTERVRGERASASAPENARTGAKQNWGISRESGLLSREPLLGVQVYRAHRNIPYELEST